MSCIKKWAMINRTIQNEKIAILALQETHLDEDCLDQVHSCFGRNLNILNSPLPSNPHASAGVAFVINKALIRLKEYSITELVPGRSILIKLKWLESCETSILNVYAPHIRGKQPVFWAGATMNRRTLCALLPDFVLGDFNITEDSIDRVPARHIKDKATEALREVHRKWNIQDTWRHTHPNSRCFTYHANAGGAIIQSRLDCIYTTPEIAQHVFDWQIKPSAVPTDHWLVKVKYAPSDAPHIGKGQWTWPLYLLKKEDLMKKVEQHGIELLHKTERLELENVDRAITNPQVLWKTFKEDLAKLAKSSSKASYHKLNSRITAIEKDLQSLLANPNLDANEAMCTNAAFLSNELEHLVRVRAKNQRTKLKAKLANQGERLGGCWSVISKEKKPRDLIHRLKIPSSVPTQYERCTKCIVKMA